jgi:glucosamine-6-phosphate deaminase
LPLGLETHATRGAAERAVAAEIAALLKQKPQAVLGLATGNTPTGVYRELARLRREEGLDLARASTFNLDEYCGLAPTSPRSFHTWMRERLFDHVNLDPRRTHLPDGLVREAELERHCEDYERAICAAGSIDLLLLGIGRNGHIGFNEPGSELWTRTRRVELHAWTRADAAEEFGGLAHVPTHAISMGIATILEARSIRVLAFGTRKSALVARTLTGPVGASWPASWLRTHPDARIVADREAAG